MLLCAYPHSPCSPSWLLTEMETCLCPCFGLDSRLSAEFMASAQFRQVPVTLQPLHLPVGSVFSPYSVSGYFYQNAPEKKQQVCGDCIEWAACPVWNFPLSRLFLQHLHISDLEFIDMSINKVSVGLALFKCVCVLQTSLSYPCFPLRLTTGGISVWATCSNSKYFPNFLSLIVSHRHYFLVSLKYFPQDLSLFPPQHFKVWTGILCFLEF